MEIKTISELLDIFEQWEDCDRRDYTDWEAAYMLWHDKLSIDNASKEHFQEWADNCYENDAMTPEERLNEYLETLRDLGFDEAKRKGNKT